MRNLSVRGTLQGQVISESVRADPPHLHLFQSPLTILIHGYQNSVANASKSYEEFQKALRKTSIVESVDSHIGSVWGFYWPGDHHNWATSVATYATRVPLAAQSGRLLAEFLQSHTRSTQELHLIAHSLGCRVALETAAAIRRMADEYTGARISKVFLLAAAVPEIFCSTEEYPFGSTLTHCEEHVFWSNKDRALGAAFEAGQYLLGEAGRAVGRHGGPQARWHSPRPSTDLSHGKYWQSDKIARSVAQILGVTADRRIEARALTEAREDLPSWDRALRTLPVRRLPGRD
jgi:pimeloyl-ACP methyl ester carboxylesterase